MIFNTKGRRFTLAVAMIIAAALVFTSCTASGKSEDTGAGSAVNQGDSGGADSGSNSGTDNGSGGSTGGGADKGKGADSNKLDSNAAATGDMSWILGVDTKDIDGNAFKGESVKENKLTIVNLWATWCAPCVEELPELAKISKDNKSKGVRVVGILADSVEGSGLDANPTAINAAKELLKKAGVTYPSLVPDKAIVNNLLSQGGYLPLTIYIDGNGKIVKSQVGSGNAEQFQADIDELLKKA